VIDTGAWNHVDATVAVFTQALERMVRRYPDAIWHHRR
jgi:hypothetical protein